MSRTRLRAGPSRVALAGLVTCMLVVAVPAGVAAQESSDPQAGNPEVEGRIAAQRHEDDHVEFALQLRADGEAWTEWILPALRFFPPNADIGRWLHSSPLLVRHTGAPGESVPLTEVELRIAARRVDGDRVEFALQQRPPDGEWSERILPARRLFPMGAEVARRLVSSPLSVELTEPSPVADDGDGPPVDDAADAEPGAVEVSDDLLDFDMIDVRTGATVNVRSLVDGETPLLFWLWSPY